MTPLASTFRKATEVCAAPCRRRSASTSAVSLVTPVALRPRGHVRGDVVPLLSRLIRSDAPMLSTTTRERHGFNS